MNKFFLKAVSLVLAGSLGAVCAVSSFAEAGTTAVSEEIGTTNLGTGDIDNTGSLTAADARALARSIDGNADKISVKDGDFNMDDKVNDADVGILLRAAAGILPSDKLNSADFLAKNGLGYYDRAVTANGKTYSVAEYNYYYSSFYYSYMQQSYQYDSYYGEGYGAAFTGFDYKTAPDKQYITDDNGQKMLFSDYFHQLTVNAVEQYSYFSAKAYEAGLVLDEDDYKSIEENKSNLISTAEQYGMTADELLVQQYGAGMNSYVFNNIVVEQIMAQKYQEYVNKDISDKITDEELEKQYSSNPSDYDYVNLRAFRLPVDTDSEGKSNVEEQKKKAEEFMGKVKDESSFLEAAKQADPQNFSKDVNSLIPNADYATLVQYLGEDAAKWSFDASRKNADMRIINTERYIYVLFVVSSAKRNEEKLPSVRHILVSFDGEQEATDETVTNPDGSKVLTKDEASALAEKYLAEYKRGKKTEEKFAALAEKYSEDTASLKGGQSGTEGGLYANIRRGAFVTEFENWAYDETRKPGDTGIIETAYGFHIMYFVGTAEEEDWKSVIRNELASEKTDEYMHKLSEQYEGSADYSEEFVNSAKQYALSGILKDYD